jgi:hypothetical protein
MRSSDRRISEKRRRSADEPAYVITTYHSLINFVDCQAVNEITAELTTLSLPRHVIDPSHSRKDLGQ